MTVEGDHVYHVATFGALVHNATSSGPGGPTPVRAPNATTAVEPPVNTSGYGNVGGGATTAENALTQGENYLGAGYKEIALASTALPMV